jgi:two-component system chemotaxis response regulator CheB
MTAAQLKRDIVVLGASAGGIEALSALVQSLPGDLPATLFVAQHMAPTFSSRLPEVLTSRGAFRAVYPVHGQEIAPQHIYVAPPDMQMFVRNGYIEVTRGPRENGHRPSVDALFRTAARAYGPRVIGVVLTGFLDCGTAGLMSIKARGGLAIVQDPEDAHVPEMPASAIRHVRVDRVAPLATLGQVLTELVGTAAGPVPSTVPQVISAMEGDVLGVPVDFVCPSCCGALTEATTQGFSQFRCHVGHSFSMQSVVLQQNEEAERALWASVRALEESSSLAQRMAARSSGNLRERFEEKQQTLTRQAAVIRAILLGEDERAPALPLESSSKSG